MYKHKLKTTIISHLNFNQQENSANLFVFQYFVVSLRPKLDKQYNVSVSYTHLTLPTIA